MSTPSDIANTDLVLLANLALAGAADGFVDVEVIAEKAFEAIPNGSAGAPSRIRRTRRSCNRSPTSKESIPPTK